jgi:hypothetical protein
MAVQKVATQVIEDAAVSTGVLTQERADELSLGKLIQYV